VLESVSGIHLEFCDAGIFGSGAAGAGPGDTEAFADGGGYDFVFWGVLQGGSGKWVSAVDDKEGEF
jgi:hypothetical protein